MHFKKLDCITFVLIKNYFIPNFFLQNINFHFFKVLFPFMECIMDGRFFRNFLKHQITLLFLHRFSKRSTFLLFKRFNILFFRNNFCVILLAASRVHTCLRNAKFFGMFSKTYEKKNFQLFKAEKTVCFQIQFYDFCNFLVE